MDRFPQSVGEKGSQKWIQRLINKKPELLNLRIRRNLGFPENEEIRWISPLEGDDYAEYRDQAFIKLLGVKLEKMPLEDFWPRGGPQWDAIGRSSSGKLLLVEAKSHIQELISTIKTENEDSLRKICKSLEETKRYLNSTTEIDWSSRFYQYTNRLAHLFFLRELNQLPAYLIFVYFMNDLKMYGPKTIDEWKGALKLLHSYLGIGRHQLQKFITDIFVDVGHLDSRAKRKEGKLDVI